jgi:hypothetical protein
MFLQKVKKMLKKFFVDVFKVNDKNSRIRIRIHLSEARTRNTAIEHFLNGAYTLIFTPFFPDRISFLVFFFYFMDLHNELKVLI